MWQERLSKKYAKALSIAVKNNKSINGELVAIKEFIATNKALEQFLDSPVIDIKAKKEIIAKITQQKELRNFMTLIISKNRFVLLDKIVAAYQNILTEESGKKKGVVYAPHELSAETLENITTLISKKYKYDVDLRYCQDSNITGGFKAVVGYQVVDATIDNTLERLKEKG